MPPCRALLSHGPSRPTPASYLTKTAKKVRKAATKLGIRVNYPVRGLTDQRSDLVGVVAAGRDNPFRVLQIDPEIIMVRAA
jgi:DNA-binding LacI/PurR family transcriptional regulator